MSTTVKTLALIVLYVGDIASQHASSYAVPGAPMSFRIAPQPVDRALKAFALQAHLQLIFVTDEVLPSTSANEVIGVYAPEVALAKLLANACVRYRFVNANTVAVEVLHSPCR